MKQHRPRQAAEKLAAGDASKDHGPVFASAVVPPLDAANVRREFRAIASAAGIDEAWAPR